MPRVVVIGAGAAGTMAAIFAAAGGAETVLLERTGDGGRKILISGGGRCNILPSRADYARFVTDSPPHLARSIARSWPLEEQVAFFERELELPLVEEGESGKLFPRSQNAREVRDKLLAAARGNGVTVVSGALVTNVARSDGGWSIARAGQTPLEGNAVILATGGLSVPATGSDGQGLEIARRLGHTIHPTYPALTPLTGFTFAHLSGVSVPATLAARSRQHKAEATGGFLFTHRGYSGPSVLDVSHVAVRSLEHAEPAQIRVRWTARDEREWEQALRPRGTQTVQAAVAEVLPHRLAEALIRHAKVDPAEPLSQLQRAERLRVIDMLVRGTLPWEGHEGYRKAEVTGGGVSLSDLDPKTMASRTQRGLYLCGEMLDAFGPIGGYNFLWAWATGRAAGIAAAAMD